MDSPGWYSANPTEVLSFLAFLQSPTNSVLANLLYASVAAFPDAATALFGALATGAFAPLESISFNF